MNERKVMHLKISLS